ncbi:hypothetical protein EK904_001894 [Melospiza melodia maxima]|nr:hypothetical protein EK904_001894 [Melospiza melodia maxima]
MTPAKEFQISQILQRDETQNETGSLNKHKYRMKSLHNWVTGLREADWLLYTKLPPLTVPQLHKTEMDEANIWLTVGFFSVCGRENTNGSSIDEVVPIK